MLAMEEATRRQLDLSACCLDSRVMSDYRLTSVFLDAETKTVRSTSKSPTSTISSTSSSGSAHERYVFQAVHVQSIVCDRRDIPIYTLSSSSSLIPFALALSCLRCRSPVIRASDLRTLTSTAGLAGRRAVLLRGFALGVSLHCQQTPAGHQTAQILSSRH